MEKSFKVFKSRIFIIGISFILLLCICFAIYSNNRRIKLKSDYLLINYESLEPVEIVHETVDGIVYKDYLFGEEIGRVIVKSDGMGVTIRDNQNGFIKEYRYHVLYGVYDFEKEELLAEIKSYINPKFWFGGTREVVTKYDSFYRSDEECREIGQLLLEEQYDKITENNKNEIVITKNGTYFIN